MKTIGIIATLDTKSDDVKYLKKKIEERGKRALIIDVSLRASEPLIKPDITNAEVAKAGGYKIDDIDKMARGDAIDAMKKGLANILIELYKNNKINGAIGIGGLDGAILISHGLRALPFWIPKLLLTPAAQGRIAFGSVMGTKDVFVGHSVIDLMGVNELSKKIYDLAVGAIVGMVESNVDPVVKEKNLISVTMYGNTTPCVMKAKPLLEKEGYHIVAFHPNGTGGMAMDQLIEDGAFAAVWELTPHELVDYILGGEHAGGPTRMDAISKVKVPTLFVPGCADFMILHPDKVRNNPMYKDRKMYYFNPLVMLIRLNAEEMKKIADVYAQKLNKAKGPTTVIAPLRGLSMYNVENGPLHDPEVDLEFINYLKRKLDPKIRFIEVDAHINDMEFAEKCVDELLALLKKS